MKLVEHYLQTLYTDTRAQGKEWQGDNIPVGDDSNRPNLIRKCFTFESKRQKINCLRKLRDQAAMNPFYQARLDRFVDAITQTYEPTNEPGTIPGNEFKETGVGDDLPQSVMEIKKPEDINEYMDMATYTMALIFDEVFKKYGTMKRRMIHKKCGKILTNETQQICKSRIEIQYYKMVMNELQKRRPLCKKNRNPQKCSKKITKKLVTLRRDLSWAERDYKSAVEKREKRLAKKKAMKQWDQDYKSQQGKK